MSSITRVARLPALRLSPSPARTRIIASRSFYSRSSLNGAQAAHAEQTSVQEHRSRSILSDIAERRARAGKLVAGVAAASHSDMFKGPQTNKPMAKRWNNHLTSESLSREPCTLKKAAKYLKQPGIVSLCGGLPSSELFPFSDISMTVPMPSTGFAPAGETVSIGKYDVRDKDATYDLSIALNYGQATGSAQMIRFLTEHTEIICQPPYADWGVCQTIGSTGALEEVLRMFCDKDRGDSVLTEAFSFTTALETISPLGVKTFGLPIDEQGLIPEAMDELLSNWDPEARGARRPHLLYTVPSGQNPTGATQGEARRRAIYAVAQKHDVFIIEDEPYYFLQMQPYTGRNEPAAPPPRDVHEFVSSLIPTYVSMDVDGRVVRLDSFSKVTVPGSRLGWIVASDQIVERYQRHAEVASQGPSGFSQVLIHKLLDETWGHEGYLQWLMNLRLEYTKKRDALLAACEDHLPTDILWLNVDYSAHPQAGKKSIEEIEQEIFDACVKSNVLLARGSWFLTEKDKPLKELHFRTTFATAPQKDMDTAIMRFGKALRDSFSR
ncbi:Aromatic amino acid aminotransferase [Escovopsis weberi]|uniref:aromatic-amino-acid transaminase n=1 Tax=Escovopsis weberi TaxID=150374 RepID=A0A0M8MY40_ESCWE|nr:Aromatic amino acid aminotransferase [Escovopsis weberi]